MSRRGRGGRRPIRWRALTRKRGRVSPSATSRNDQFVAKTQAGRRGKLFSSSAMRQGRAMADFDVESERRRRPPRHRLSVEKLLEHPRLVVAAGLVLTALVFGTPHLLVTYH